MGRDGAIRDLLGDTLVPIPVFLHIMWSLGRDVPVQLRKPTLNQFLRGCWCCFYGRRHPDLCSSSMDDSAVCEMRNAIITNKDRRSAKISVNVTGTLLLKLRAKGKTINGIALPTTFRAVFGPYMVPHSARCFVGHFASFASKALLGCVWLAQLATSGGAGPGSVFGFWGSLPPASLHRHRQEISWTRQQTHRSVEEAECIRMHTQRQNDLGIQMGDDKKPG